MTEKHQDHQDRQNAEREIDAVHVAPCLVSRPLANNACELAGDDYSDSNPATHGPDRQAAAVLAHCPSGDGRRWHPDQRAAEAHREQRNAEDHRIGCHCGASEAGQREDEAAPQDGQELVTRRERRDDERANEVGQHVGRAQETGDRVRVIEIIADRGEEHAVGEPAKGLRDDGPDPDEDDGCPSAGCSHRVIVTKYGARRRVRRFR